MYMHTDNLYEKYFGEVPEITVALAPHGSARRYWLQGGGNQVKAVLTNGENNAENDAFIYLARHLYDKSLPVPELLCVSDDRKWYLQSFVGYSSLYDLIVKGTVETATLEECMRLLANIQVKGADGMDWDICYPVEEINRRAVMWDLNYFKYSFLKLYCESIDETRLEDDFNRIAESVTGKRIPQLLVLRDFQSRNVMVDDNGKISVIDFQGARRGNPLYDVASFVNQTRAGFDRQTRLHLINMYKNELERLGVCIPDSLFKQQFNIISLFRSLQTLGTYGFRGVVQGNARFGSQIPKGVRSALENDVCREYPEVYRCLTICDKTVAHKKVEATDRLTVKVNSFSFKKGYPEDESGNGGGFVFDCRWMHNPGRYEQYRQLTGRDNDVIAFLEEQGECRRFVEGCFELVKPAVQNYVERGFSSLSISFGCTGGQHRSVYCADMLARFLKQLFPLVNIVLNHRERRITEYI